MPTVPLAPQLSAAPPYRSPVPVASSPPSQLFPLIDIPATADATGLQGSQIAGVVVGSICGVLLLLALLAGLMLLRGGRWWVCEALSVCLD